MAHYFLFRSAKFEKSLEKVSQWVGFDREKMEHVLTLLETGNPLPREYQEHTLKGKYLGIYECHVSPDILLIYQKIKDKLIIVMVNIGSHSSLFKK